jgi:hypothetical protein
MVIELDFESGTVKETEAVETLEKYEDPEIQRILRAAEERQAKQSTASYKLRDPNMPTARKFEAKVRRFKDNQILKISETLEKV